MSKKSEKKIRIRVPIAKRGVIAHKPKNWYTRKPKHKGLNDNG